MSTEKWFAMVENQVKGPFEKTELEGRLSGWPGVLIWGRGQNEWLAPDRWQKSLLESAAQKNVTANSQRQNEKSSEKSADRHWRLLIDNKESKPMLYDQMIQHLQGKTDLTDIRIWTEGYTEWREIYQIHIIMDELGVSRRTHPRVPIMGTLLCEATGQQYTARLLSISQGGLGATEGPKAKIGEKLKVTLKSSNLANPITATVEVVYVGHAGYFGMKFLGLQTESKNLIIEYIKKFT